MTNNQWDKLMLDYSRGVVPWEELVTKIKADKR